MLLLYPFFVRVHEHANEQRVLCSTRWASHPKLKPLYPDNVPESYSLKRMQKGWAAGGHYHYAKNELFECMVGDLTVNLAWVEEGVSYKASVSLNADRDEYLVIPAGIWHEVICNVEGSCLQVFSSTHFKEAPHTDEARHYPTKFNAEHALAYTVR